MTVNLNLAGLPAVCLPCGFVEQPGGAKLPVGIQVRCTRGVVWVCLWQLDAAWAPLLGLMHHPLLATAPTKRLTLLHAFPP